MKPLFKYRKARTLCLWGLTALSVGFSGSAQGGALHGAGVGGLGGALVGSLSGPSKNRQENALIGGVIGAALGAAIGNEQNKSATLNTVTVLETSPSATLSQWIDPDTGVVISAEPASAVMEQGRVCRKVTLKGTVDGEEAAVLAKACRSRTGDWYIVDQKVLYRPQQVVYYQPPLRRVIYYSEPTLIIQRQRGWRGRSRYDRYDRYEERDRHYRYSDSQHHYRR